MLIFGAGTVGVQTASAMTIAGNLKLLGFVDEDPSKIGQTINGIPVFSPSDVTVIVKKLEITDILLAIPSVTRDRRNKIIQSLLSLPVHTRTLPGLADLASGRVTVQDFRELDIDDLLGRDAVKPQADLLASKLHNHTILVTGAGGSIGSELCRQILRERPRRLLLLDHSEFALYTLHRELEAVCDTEASPVELVPLLASVVNRRRLDWICATYRPDTVYHAAAYKHVPMVECNPSEGIFNNVFGTLNMAQSAIAAKVGNFVLVSTDKAVRPTNLMGASKRMAELVLQALANQAEHRDTCFSMVRFGNVLGSSGSVVPLFRDQLARGGPLTVTHPEVTRYFMTIPEAVQLVLQAAVMADGGEVFVLEMGEPVKIIDLARRLVELSGLQIRDELHPDGDIGIAFIGLRPGEKLYEELLIGDNPKPTSHSRIMMAHEDFMAWPELQYQLQQLQHAANAEDAAGIKSVLLSCVHGFHEQPS
jgi:FlaA1/EpsC-like NDP-sugar epimerase